LGNLDDALAEPISGLDQGNDTFAHGQERMILAEDNEEFVESHIIVNHHDMRGRIQTTTPLNMQNALVTEKCDFFEPGKI